MEAQSLFVLADNLYVKEIKWVYFLQFTKKLTDNFFRLDHVLKQSTGSTLVPLTTQFLNFHIDKSESYTIVCLIENTAQREAFLKAQNSIIHFLSHYKTQLILISSFSNLQGIIPSQLGQNKVQFIALPAEIPEVCDRIMMAIHNAEFDRNEKTRWPWGRLKLKYHKDLI